MRLINTKPIYSLKTDFNFIDICVRNQDNKNIELKDFRQISVYID